MGRVELRIEVDEALAEWLEILEEETGWRLGDIVNMILWRFYEMWRLGRDWAEFWSKQPRRKRAEARARAPQTS